MKHVPFIVPSSSSDVGLETAAIAQMRADRTPPFTSREVVVRLLATTYPAHALEPSVRRAAARDKLLEWRAGTGGYGYRGVVAPAPAVEPFSGPVDACASAGQADRSADRDDNALAPGNRGLDLISGAPDLYQSADDAAEGVGA